jgi:hypothetical protein
MNNVRALTESTEVVFDPRLVSPMPNIMLDKDIHWLTHMSDTERLRHRADIMQASRPAKPLPEGKTLADIVQGQWPGDETDEEIKAALKRLS